MSIKNHHIQYSNYSFPHYSSSTAVLTVIGRNIHVHVHINVQVYCNIHVHVHVYMFTGICIRSSCLLSLINLVEFVLLFFYLVIKLNDSTQRSSIVLIL